MVVVRMKYVRRVKSKGKDYFYYRREDINIERLPDDSASPEFLAAYARAHQTYERNNPVPLDNIILPGTFRALAVDYLKSITFTSLRARTQHLYRRDIDRLCETFGNERLETIQMEHVLAYRDTVAGTPAQANSLMKAGRIVYGWGRPRGRVRHNPFDFRGTDIKPLKIGEHQPWPEPLVEKFLAEAAPCAVFVVLFGLNTGQRIGDVLKMNWNDIESDTLDVIQEKTRKKLTIPLHYVLKAVIRTIPRRSTRVLTTTKGLPWTKTNWSDYFAREQRRVGIPKGYVFHGFRKNAVQRLLEAGCTPKEAGGITGQSVETVLYYARHMEQKKLARVAMAKLEAWSRNQ